jgi:hypothetical protein
MFVWRKVENVIVSHSGMALSSLMFIPGSQKCVYIG